MARKLIKREALNEFANLYTKILKEQLEQNKPFAKRASGQLIQSIKTTIEEVDGNDTIVVNAEPYLKFVDKGVSGTIRKYNTPYSYRQFPPRIDAISNWVRLKGLPQEAVFPIRNKIFRYGIKPTNVINKTIREIEYKSKFMSKFEGGIAEEVIEMAKKSFGIK